MRESTCSLRVNMALPSLQLIARACPHEQGHGGGQSPLLQSSNATLLRWGRAMSMTLRCSPAEMMEGRYVTLLRFRSLGGVGSPCIHGDVKLVHIHISFFMGHSNQLHVVEM